MEAARPRAQLPWLGLYSGRKTHMPQLWSGVFLWLLRRHDELWDHMILYINEGMAQEEQAADWRIFAINDPRIEQLRQMCVAALRIFFKHIPTGTVKVIPYINIIHPLFL